MSKDWANKLHIIIFDSSLFLLSPLKNIFWLHPCMYLKEARFLLHYIGLIYFNLCKPDSFEVYILWSGSYLHYSDFNQEYIRIAHSRAQYYDCLAWFS